MTLVAVIAVIFLISAAGFGLAGALTTFEIVDALNLKLPQAEHLEPFGWYPAKTLRVIRQYRHLYPEGTIVRRLGIFAAAGFASLIGAATAIGFPWFGITWLAAGASVILWFVFWRKPRP